MKKQKILFVSHCILNTASKVIRAESESFTTEAVVRKAFLQSCLNNEIQLIQLPCPEFTLYGPCRWGHVKDQFDHVFFRDHCTNILGPYIQQLQTYLAEGSKRFEVLGIIGVEGSPSCGVERSCSGAWGGEFSHRDDLTGVLLGVHTVPEAGVFIEVLTTMLNDSGITLPIIGLDRLNPKPLYQLTGMEQS